MFIKKIVALLAFGVSILGCENAMPNKEKILKPGPVTIFQVASQPTEPAERKVGILYKNGFAVTGTASFSAEQSDGLRKALASPKNYNTKDTKRCIFTPSYYLQLDTAMGLLLAKEPCSKILFTHNGKDTIMDLLNNNSIEKVLAEMWKPKE
ncbi:MAG: hypothetical protein ABIX01_00910 [Chitinophagaceae bacterium]